MLPSQMIVGKSDFLVLVANALFGIQLTFRVDRPVRYELFIRESGKLNYLLSYLDQVVGEPRNSEQVD